MDFSIPPETEAFRHEVRSWLAAHVTDEYRGLELDLSGSGEWLARMRAWNALLADAGYAAIDWPVEHGGRGAGLLEQVVLAEELSRAEAPPALNPIGLANIAPAIMQFGTAEQKERHLRPMLRGEEIWCQGFSEPDAGSDLAALSTSAAIDGEHFVVNGQKVWNTLGQVADWCELLVRTDPDAPKHQGISCLLLDMRSPGVDVRPLVTIAGEEEFSELFFTDVRVPRSALLGELHQGWSVAMSTLANERAGVAQLHLQVRKRVDRMIELARQTSDADGSSRSRDPVLRRRLAAAYLESELLRLLAYRGLSRQLHDRPAGPESSLAKLVWSDLEQDLAELAGEVLGPAGNTGTWGRDRLNSRSYSIAGGTTQVNKNVLAQRVLGLPRR